MKEFQERLALEMKRQGINQSELARKLRTSQATVSRWFNGSQPRGRMLEDLSEVLGVSKAWLLTGESENNHNPLSNKHVMQTPTISGTHKVERFGKDFFEWDAIRVELVESTLKKLSGAMNYAAVADPETEEGYKGLAFFHLKEFYEQAQALRLTRPAPQVCLVENK